MVEGGKTKEEDGGESKKEGEVWCHERDKQRSKVYFSTTTIPKSKYPQVNKTAYRKV